MIVPALIFHSYTAIMFTIWIVLSFRAALLGTKYERDSALLTGATISLFWIFVAAWFVLKIPFLIGVWWRRRDTNVK